MLFDQVYCPMFLPIFAIALFQTKLNRGLKPRLVVLVKGGKPKRLKTPRDRIQHFYGTEHGTARDEEHDSND